MLRRVVFEGLLAPGARAVFPELWEEVSAEMQAHEECLIHADLANYTSTSNDDAGIYMNPYIRVAYSRRVLSWLPITQRFERLYPHIHTLINYIGQRPGSNPRRLEQPGDEVVDRVWRWDEISLSNNSSLLEGAFEDVKRVAAPGQFCGGRKLLVINEHPAPGESHWGSVDVPAGGAR